MHVVIITLFQRKLKTKKMMENAMKQINEVIDTSAQLLTIVNAVRRCKRCGYDYTERENLGTWQCLRFHPCFWNALPGASTYKCCGKATGSNGCVKADHIDREEERTEPTKILAFTKALIDDTNVVLHNHYRDNITRATMVNRFDTVEYEKKIHYGAVSAADKRKAEACLRAYNNKNNN